MTDRRRQLGQIPIARMPAGRSGPMKLRHILGLLVVPMVLGGHEAVALSCMPAKTQIERAAVVVSVTPITGVALDDRRIFQVEINEVWKGPASADQIVVVYGAGNLLLGEKYFVAASFDDDGRIVISQCTLVREFHRLETSLLELLGPPGYIFTSPLRSSADTE